MGEAQTTFYADTHDRFGSIIRDNSFGNRIPAVAFGRTVTVFLFSNSLGRRYAVQPTEQMPTSFFRFRPDFRDKYTRYVVFFRVHNSLNVFVTSIFRHFRNGRRGFFFNIRLVSDSAVRRFVHRFVGNGIRWTSGHDRTRAVIIVFFSEYFSIERRPSSEIIYCVVWHEFRGHRSTFTVSRAKFPAGPRPADGPRVKTRKKTLCLGAVKTF